MSQKDLSNVSAVKYGISNESKAAEWYAEYMKASGNYVQVLACGVVILDTMPWLAASPDRKIDDRQGMWLPEEACADPNYFCHLVNGKPELKKDHPSYYHVQGQLGLTGLKWCDFVMFLQKGLIIRQIKFDELFWKSMTDKLTKFYQQHVMLESIEQQ